MRIVESQNEYSRVLAYPYAGFPLANFFARSEFFIVNIENNLLKI
jgi:hypothetical protein